MNETQMAAPESYPADSRTWIGRILVGVVLGQAIWGFLASITTNLALPAMARFMGGDAQSPLYLGKGEINVAALFTSLLELCFAGIVAVVMNSWLQRHRRVASKSLRPTAFAPSSHPPVVPLPAESPISPAANTGMQGNPTVTTMQPAQPSADVAEPAKQKPPKKVYYNIVGEPVESDEE